MNSGCGFRQQLGSWQIKVSLSLPLPFYCTSTSCRHLNKCQLVRKSNRSRNCSTRRCVYTKSVSLRWSWAALVRKKQILRRACCISRPPALAADISSRDAESCSRSKDLRIWSSVFSACQSCSSTGYLPSTIKRTRIDQRSR